VVESLQGVLQPVAAVEAALVQAHEAAVVVQEPDVELWLVVKVATVDVGVLALSLLVVLAYDVEQVEMVIAAAVFVLAVDVLVQTQDHAHIAHKNSLVQR